MFEILMFLFESYFDAGSYPDSDKLSLKLTAAGFEDEDINLALTWLSGLKRLNATDYPASINQSGTRCFAELEAKRISMEGLHFLTFWEQNMIISPVEREMIIDRAVALGRENLSLDKVKLIALMVLWNLHQDLDPLLVEELLAPAEASLLH
jgi:Smg protein